MAPAVVATISVAVSRAVLAISPAERAWVFIWSIAWPAATFAFFACCVIFFFTLTTTRLAAALALPAADLAIIFALFPAFFAFFAVFLDTTALAIFFIGFLALAAFFAVFLLLLLFLPDLAIASFRKICLTFYHIFTFIHQKSASFSTGKWQTRRNSPLLIASTAWNSAPWRFFSAGCT